MKNTLILFLTCFIFSQYSIAQSECTNAIELIKEAKINLTAALQESDPKYADNLLVTMRGANMGQLILMEFNNTCKNEQAQEVAKELDHETRIALDKAYEKFPFSDVEIHINKSLLLADKAIKTLESNKTNSIDQPKE